MNGIFFGIGILLYMILDNLDGIHARATNQTSVIGEILDHCGDSFVFVIVFEMICEILGHEVINDSYKMILFMSIISVFNLMHLYNKYSNNMILGYKILSIDEIILLIPIFTNMFTYNILSINITKSIINYIIILCIFVNTNTLYKIKKSLDDTNYKKCMIDLVILISILLIYPILTSFKIQYLMPYINLFYVYELINSKNKLFAKTI